MILTLHFEMEIQGFFVQGLGAQNPCVQNPCVQGSGVSYPAIKNLGAETRILRDGDSGGCFEFHESTGQRGKLGAFRLGEESTL